MRGFDPEILLMISDAAKAKYTNIIQELISISRSSQSNSYLVNKNSQPREVLDVHAFNVTNLDRVKGIMPKPVPFGQQPEAPKLSAQKVADFEVICTSNA